MTGVLTDLTEAGGSADTIQERLAAWPGPLCTTESSADTSGLSSNSQNVISQDQYQSNLYINFEKQNRFLDFADTGSNYCKERITLDIERVR